MLMKRVLIASKYSSFLNKKSNLLMRMGFHIHTAMHGAEAFKLHEKHHFDLILIDSKLEDMCGTSFCTLIRQGNVSPRVHIMFACYQTPGTIQRAEECGADTILTKPIDPINLIEMMGAVLNLKLTRAPRVELRVKVLCKSQYSEFSCVSHDISTTGILLETEYELFLGERIICQFILTDQLPVTVEGVVIRFKTAPEYMYFYGVKFLSLPVSVRERIDEYIASIPTHVPLRIDGSINAGAT